MPMLCIDQDKYIKHVSDANPGIGSSGVFNLKKKMNYRTPILPTNPQVAIRHLWWSECIFFLFSFHFDIQMIANIFKS